jgi:predicted Abi (CAAX) family protease
MRSFTKSFTLIGLLLCLVHYLFHDYETIYLLFYSLSVPAWFAPLFTNVADVSGPKLIIIYLLTIATWAIIGYIIDRFSVGYRRRRSR